MIQQYATPPRFGTEPLPPGEYALICQECRHVFASTDPDRKWCDLHLVERVNGAGILEDDTDDLFTLHPHTCGDCGAAFESSARHATRCALCASLRTGQVGAATVVCPACRVEHQIPILSPTTLCGPCRVDPVLTLANCQARYAAAVEAARDTTERMLADYAHADEQDQARYDAALALRETRPAHVVTQAWDNAIRRADGLAPLLVARRAWDAATAALEAAQAGLRAVEEYTQR